MLQCQLKRKLAKANWKVYDELYERSDTLEGEKGTVSSDETEGSNWEGHVTGCRQGFRSDL